MEPINRAIFPHRGHRLTGFLASFMAVAVLGSAGIAKAATIIHDAAGNITDDGHYTYAYNGAG